MTAQEYLESARRHLDEADRVLAVTKRITRTTWVIVAWSVLVSLLAISISIWRLTNAL